MEVVPLNTSSDSTIIAIISALSFSLLDKGLLVMLISKNIELLAAVTDNVSYTLVDTRISVFGFLDTKTNIRTNSESCSSVPGELFEER